MIVAVKKIENGQIYIDKEIVDKLGEIALAKYNYTPVYVSDKYEDCEPSDFNDDLTFSIEKYEERKQKDYKEKRKSEIKECLNELSKDLIQAYAGAKIDNLDAKIKEFRTLHNELRTLEGKELRVYED